MSARNEQVDSDVDLFDDAEQADVSAVEDWESLPFAHIQKSDVVKMVKEDNAALSFVNIFERSMRPYQRTALTAEDEIQIAAANEAIESCRSLAYALRACKELKDVKLPNPGVQTRWMSKYSNDERETARSFIEDCLAQISSQLPPKAPSSQALTSSTNPGFLDLQYIVMRILRTLLLAAFCAIMLQGRVSAFDNKDELRTNEEVDVPPEPVPLNEPTEGVTSDYLTDPSTSPTEPDIPTTTEEPITEPPTTTKDLLTTTTTEPSTTLRGVQVENVPNSELKIKTQLIVRVDFENCTVDNIEYKTLVNKDRPRTLQVNQDYGITVIEYLCKGEICDRAQSQRDILKAIAGFGYTWADYIDWKCMRKLAFSLNNIVAKDKHFTHPKKRTPPPRISLPGLPTAPTVDNTEPLEFDPFPPFEPIDPIDDFEFPDLGFDDIDMNAIEDLEITDILNEVERDFLGDNEDFGNIDSFDTGNFEEMESLNFGSFEDLDLFKDIEFQPMEDSFEEANFNMH